MARLVLTLIAALALAAPARAQEKSAVRPGFALPAGGSARILLLRPWIKVGAQSTAGIFEPNADWTDQARANIAAALDAAQERIGNRVFTADDGVGPSALLLADYRALFDALAESVIAYQFFKGNRLPTKKREGAFAWTLGSGVRDIPGAAEADYILFLDTEDHFGSTGRKVIQALLGATGIPLRSGVHKGFAGLVEVRTGDLVWLNADMAMGGDVRTAPGAAKRVAQLLEDFPAR